MGTEKHKVEVITDLLNIFYGPEMLGTELKKKATFVRFVIEKLDEGQTETQIRNLLIQNLWHEKPQTSLKKN